MRINYTCKTKERDYVGTNAGILTETQMVKKYPQGKNGVQVGVVRQYDPVTLAKVETLADQYHGLFAGGQ